MSAGRNKRREKPVNRTVIFLLVALAASLFYIAYGEYSKLESQKIRSAFDLGYRQGVTDTVTKLYEESESCQPVPVFLGNRTKNVIDVSCLVTQENANQTQP